ncbi:ATP-grasp fold amidoligase family protein [Salinicoccus hispanicus]
MMNKAVKNILSYSISFLPDKFYSHVTFVLRHKRLPNHNKTGYFNDMMVHKKLTDKNIELKRLVDKYHVRSHIEKEIGSDHLIPLVGVYKDPEEVNFEELPSAFVLKMTFGAQNNLICTDKSTLNWEKQKTIINKWLKYDAYKRTREWQYDGLEKQFVIEEYISDAQGKTNDYKFWCFHGEPKIVQVNVDRLSEVKRNMYYAENFEFIDDLYFANPHSEEPIDMPENYQEMLNIARKLSTGHEFLRVDLYNIDGKIYFGELTLYPDNCNIKMKPLKYEKIFGDMLSIKS